MASDYHEVARDLAVACLQHEDIVTMVLATTPDEIKVGDASALGKKVGEFERAIYDTITKPAEHKP